ncbi:hypothetical protein VHEMI01263 [[Torrubiella] hemipterigena]|uniref:Carbohydrate kinase PfkB domain-containing protein n=1 Tax=[Torrubiella] hemipterigena TaxID=1531966 RepID=A0A0A1SLF8_9HYPO|nr:hypothetical protein VHEMI01263 [[Torrubiella] hemipterigena]
MKHLILVGACYLDTILTVPHYPEEDAKLRATNLSVRRGGNCPNSLQVLLDLIPAADTNTKLHLVSCLPRKDSLASQRILSSFGNNSSRLHFGHCIYREDYEEAASSYIIRSDQTGSRTLVNYNNLPEITVDEFSQIASSFSPDDQTWWHFEGRIPETTLECIRLLRGKLPNTTISVEVEKPGREGLVQLAASADVVFYSRTWAEHRGYKSAEQCLQTEKPKRGFCPWGALGAGAVTHDAKYTFAPVPNEPITVIE